VPTLARDEQTWLTADDPFDLFSRFDLPDHPRRARLWLVGCCRLVWEHLPPRARAAVGVAERFAEGRATTGDLAAALAAVEAEAAEAEAEFRRLDDELYERCVAVELSRPSLPTDDIRERMAAIERRREAVRWVAAAGSASFRVASYFVAGRDPDRADTARLLRCVFGNPFRPVALDPVWRTDTVLALARQMCDTGDFFAMPILADALQEAGCEDEAVLAHCRGDGPHVRGCWACDLVLGKE
jgi:hypothetical protein